MPVAHAQEQPTSLHPANLEKVFTKTDAKAERAGKAKSADASKSAAAARDGKVRYATSYAKAEAERAASRAIDKMTTGAIERGEAKNFARSSDKVKARRKPAEASQTAKVGKTAKTVKATKGGKGGYHGIIARYASSYGVPVSLARAVVRVESNFRANARGKAGEIGLMQIKPATARMMGYRGSTKGLFNPETNIKYGMKYLAKAHKLGGGSTCGTILKYNAGHGAKRMNRISAAYCSKVKRHLGG
ncbi:lytic transglycosylase [Nitratireductor sp. StC3]|nr:lytic transglycosylase [Nitratireductor sp. StC3]